MALPKDVTQLLLAWSQGDQGARDKLIPLVYDELRRLADHYLRRERPDHTLQTTALVHEVYLRLADGSQVQWQSWAHFYNVAAQLMRRILIDHARSHYTAKRLSPSAKLSLDEAIDMSDERAAELVALDDALTSLEALDPQKSRVVELRFFGGLTTAEIAEALGVSPSTITREWRIAKLWLYHEIKKGRMGEK